MVWQLILVGVLVTAAACYLVGRAWRTWTGGKSGCGGGCGCGTKQPAAPASAQGTLIPAEHLTRRLRRDSPRGPT